MDYFVSRPAIGDLARVGRERVEDADWQLRGLDPDTGAEIEDLDDLLDAEMQRG